MLTVGITGGIGSGKSTVSSYLREKGYPVIDADAVSRALTAPGGEALPALREAFGDEIFFPDGALDRRRTAAFVFSDPEKKKQLEAIVTARVIDAIREQIAAFRAEGKCAILFLDAPLLFESGCDTLADRIWTVTAREEIRIARVLSRDGMTREEVLARMRAQMPEEEKIRLSDEVLDNSGDLDALYARIDDLLVDYVSETSGRTEEK